MRLPREQAAILILAAIIAFLSLLLLSVAPCPAQEPIGKIVKFAGSVWVRSQIKPPTGEWIRVKEKDYPVYHGDAIRTERGRAEILFHRDDGVMRVVENTMLTLRESEDRAKGLTLRRIFLTLGRVWANVIPRRGLDTRFESNAAVAGVRGTTIEFWVDANGDTWVLCTDGAVEVTAAGVTVTLTAGQATRVTPGYAPTPPSPYTAPPPPSVEELVVEKEEVITPEGAPPIVVAPVPMSPATGGGGIASPSR